MLNVLIPIDFSETSLNALRYALSFQKEFPFEITCMHAYDENKPKRRLEKFQAEFGKELEFDLVKGDLFEAFKKYTSRTKVDLIIMGTIGAFGIKRLFMGSNTSKLMLQITIPLLIIPQERKYESIKKIMWASDFKPLVNPDAMDFLKDIARALESSVRVAHVKTSDKKKDYEQTLEMKREDHFLGKDVKHSFKKIRRSSVSKGIRFYLDHKDDNDLLVLIRREYGFLDKLFRKNHAEEFACEPLLPVMIIHE